MPPLKTTQEFIDGLDNTVYWLDQVTGRVGMIIDAIEAEEPASFIRSIVADLDYDMTYPPTIAGMQKLLVELRKLLEVADGAD